MAGSAVAAQVETHDAETPARRGGDRVPARPIRTDAVDQHRRARQSAVLIDPILGAVVRSSRWSVILRFRRIA